MRDGDCADDDAAIHPGVSEACDGRDQDCDGLVDESDAVQDEDGDGFSPVLDSRCDVADFGTLQQGDCNDAELTIHPGAPDEADDGMDSDCGGHDAADPHVGLDGDVGDLSTALQNVTDGTTVWVGAGTFGHDGKMLPAIGITIRGTRPGGESILTAKLQDRPLTITASETSELVLQDLRLEGASGESGPALNMQGGHLVLKGCQLAQNVAQARGGALALSQTVADISDTFFVDNQAGTEGGALSAIDSTVTLTDVTFVGNNSTGSSNGLGGALSIEGGSLIATRVSFRNNLAPAGGGAAVLRGLSAHVENVIADGNQSDGLGGAFLVEDPQSFVLNQATILSNVASDGGGLALMVSATLEEELSSRASSSEPLFVINNALLAFNASRNLYLGASNEAVLKLTWSNLYSVGGSSHNLMTVDESVTEAAPGLVRFINDGIPDNDDLHPGPHSALLHTGDPLLLNPDGSRADIGAYGGPNADRSFYLDEDQDGLYDGWEMSFASRLNARSGLDDSDQDAASALQELQTGCDPTLPDTDGDGFKDGEELAKNSDPTDWYSQPGQSYPVAVTLDTSPGALDQQLTRIQYKGHILLPAGNWTGKFVVRNKDVVLEGTATPEESLLLGNNDDVITAVQSSIHLIGLTLSGGRGQAGGALSLKNVRAELEHVHFTNNATEQPLPGTGGGAIFHTIGSLELFDCHFESQRSNEDGGALYLKNVDSIIEKSTFLNNRAEGAGGALWLENSTLQLEECQFHGNAAGETGGSLFSTGSTLDLTDFSVTNGSVDSVTGLGGGFYFQDSRIELLNGWFKQLSASRGGALLFSSSEATLNTLWIEDAMASKDGAGLVAENHSVVGVTNGMVEGATAQNSGGGLLVDCAELSLQNATVVNSIAEVGGGIYIAKVSVNQSCPNLLLKAQNLIAAYNDNYNLYAEDARLISTTYSDYWNPVERPNHNLPLLVATNQAIEPGFQQLDSQGKPVDLHLALSSGLLNQGSPTLPDADKSVSDPGAYGGALGGTFDRDLDGYGEFFWPGTYLDAPDSVNPYRYDCNDLDASIQICE